MEDPRPEIDPEQEVTSNVVLFLPRPARREPPLTGEELAEYRKIRFRLLRMLDEWDRMKGPLGCPVARHILTDV